MGAEIEYEGGWLRRGGWCRWRSAVAHACVVAGVLWAAAPASAASPKWTVFNHTSSRLARWSTSSVTASVNRLAIIARCFLRALLPPEPIKIATGSAAH